MQNKNESIDTVDNETIKDRIRNVRNDLRYILTELRDTNGEGGQHTNELLIDIVKHDENPETRHLKALVEEQFDKDFDPNSVDPELITSVRTSIVTLSQGDSRHNEANLSFTNDPRKSNLAKNGGTYPTSSSGEKNNNTQSRG